MKREDLEKLGITDKDQLDKIMALHGQSVESNKTKVATMQTELDGLKTQLTDANNQIKSYKDMNIDDIKKAASDWEAKAKEAETNAQKQIAELKFNTALDGAISGAKAKNAKAVRALLDQNGLKYNEADGSIIGLNEQLEKIKKENDYLFEGEKQDPKIVTQTSGTSVTADAMVLAARQAAGLTNPNNGEK
jgi:hypothetical protein